MAGITIKSMGPVTILNIVELILTIIVCGLIGDLDCINVLGIRTQFISAIVYGYLLVSTFMVIASFTASVLDRQLRVIIHGTGCIMWLTASALMLEAADTGACSITAFAGYDRSVAGGVIGLAIFIIHALDTYFSWRHSTSS